VKNALFSNFQYQHNSDGYKPQMIPKALKLIRDDYEGGHNKEGDFMTESINGVLRQQQNMKYASHVMIVKDMAESQQYYRDVLGFSIEGEFVNREGVHFLFKENQNAGAVRPNSQIGVVLDAYIWIEDVDSLYEELKNKGANIVFGPQNMEYKMRDLLIEDLNGYRLCFGSPIEM